MLTLKWADYCVVLQVITSPRTQWSSQIFLELIMILQSGLSRTASNQVGYIFKKMKWINYISFDSTPHHFVFQSVSWREEGPPRELWFPLEGGLVSVWGSQLPKWSFFSLRPICWEIFTSFPLMSVCPTWGALLVLYSRSRHTKWLHAHDLFTITKVLNYFCSFKLWNVQ